MQKMITNNYLKNIDEANSYYSQGRYEDALRIYKKELKLDKNNNILLTFKGNTLYNLKKFDDAYFSYLNAFMNAGAIDVIDQYVEQNISNLQIDIQNLHDLLNYKYQIPIIHDGLLMALDKIGFELSESHRLKDWKQFQNQLDKKYFTNSKDYVHLFLNYFGENYLKHFLSFYCYLIRDRGFQLTMGDLVNLINTEKKMIKVDNFEQFIRGEGYKKQAALDHMTGRQFEEYLSTLFETQGYNVKKTQHSHDYGADLIIKRFGTSTAVQAKRQKKSVGVKAVQEIDAARHYYKTQKAIVITTSSFTISAVKMADRLGVDLWDRTKLFDEINKPRF